VKKYKPKSKEEIRRNMSAIRSSGNRTETALRKALYRLGYRYRKYSPNLPGKPDIVFGKAKVAIFVDGDFWHARLLREAGPDGFEKSIRTSNKDYWIDKFAKRVERDKAVNERLASMGWLALRFWESDIKGDIAAALSIITYHLKSRTAAKREKERSAKLSR
jgi:DNA mismatch endonuclease (patch repair protein)